MPSTRNNACMPVRARATQTRLSRGPVVAMAPSLASLLAILAPTVVVQADEFLPAASPLVLWAGRSAPGSVPGSVAFDWEGTSATFSVAGVGASVTLHTNITLPVGKAARVSVFVNDIDTANLMLDSATSSYLLATALEKPVNRVTVQYTLEPGASGASRGSRELPTFEGFSVGNKGSFVESTPLLRRIDIIGDSITAGSDYDKLQAVKGQLSLETECDPWAPITGYSQAYAWESYLCRYFQANCTTVAWSGKGLIHNSGCSPGPTMPTLCANPLSPFIPPAHACSVRSALVLPQHVARLPTSHDLSNGAMCCRYNQTFATSATELWDFSKSSRPDAVIIHLGKSHARVFALLLSK